MILWKKNVAFLLMCPLLIKLIFFWYCLDSGGSSSVLLMESGGSQLIVSKRPSAVFVFFSFSRLAFKCLKP